jgi:hypothetical protein
MSCRIANWWRLGFVAGALFLLAGCERGVVEPMPRAKFIQVMVELRKADQESTTPEAFSTKRAEILTRHGVTDSLLIAFVQAQQGDVNALAEVFDSINARLAVPADQPR